MSHVAYALTAAAERDGTTPGVIAYGDGQAFNVPEALQEGNGVFLVPEAETSLVMHLDQFDSLKRVAQPDEEQAPEPVDTLEGLDKDALVAKAQALGAPTKGTKDELRAAIREAQTQGGVTNA